jgi:hypothetical protein
VRLGVLLGLVGGIGVIAAYAMGLLSLSPERGGSKTGATPSAPSAALTGAAPAGAPVGSATGKPTATAATSAPAPSSAGIELSGAWTSDSGRVYDVVLHEGAYEFRIRDVAQFPSQGYAAGEARFRLKPIAGEPETYLVEDRIRPFPPEGLRYDLAKARASCIEVLTAVGGRPLRAQLDGERLWVRMALLEPDASMFVRKGSSVVACKGLSGARASEMDSFLTRKR